MGSANLYVFNNHASHAVAACDVYIVGSYPSTLAPEAVIVPALTLETLAVVTLFSFAGGGQSR